jgi:hypothetical protein
MCLLSPLNSFVIQGREQSHIQYLQSYSGERTNTYHDIYKTIQGGEQTHTTIFTKLFRGQN